MHIERAQKFALSLGVDEFRIEPCTFRTDYGIDVFRKYASSTPEFQRIEYIDFDNNMIMPTPDRYSPYCTVTHNNLYITVNGDVAPCCGVDQNDMPMYGNLLKQSLGEVWNSQEARLFRRQVLKDRHSHTACQNCSFPMQNIGKLFDDTEFSHSKPQYKSQSKIYIQGNSVSD
ncbi:MAG: SPASM domain-containing protein [Thermodesulfobacteriota bacterium]